MLRFERQHLNPAALDLKSKTCLLRQRIEYLLPPERCNTLFAKNISFCQLH